MQMDLANEVIRAAYRPKAMIGDISARKPEAVRNAVMASKRFVLDSAMSSLMAHMATTPFECPKDKRPDILTSMRRSAVPPFAKMFVQFDGKAFRDGLLAAAGDKKDVWGQDLALPDDVIDPVGWLIETETVIDKNGSAETYNIVMVSEYFMIDGDVITLPFVWTYTTDEAELPPAFLASSSDKNATHFTLDKQAAQLAHGLTGHDDPHMAIIYMNRGGKSFIPDHDIVTIKEEGKPDWRTHVLVAEMGGVLRYLFAFLNTLNEVPVSYERARPTQRFLANGKSRSPVEYSLVRLVLPNRTISYRQVVRGIMQSVRHKQHPVRGHWRLYGAHTCDDGAPHSWGPTDATGHADCAACNASRTWIKDHKRGDPLLGVIDRTYSVGAR